MVIWSIQAKADLKQIFASIHRDSKFYAKKVTREIVERSMLLQELTRMGRVAPEVGEQNVRELFLYSYRIVYEIIGDNIQVLAVVHKRRDFKAGDIGK